MGVMLRMALHDDTRGLANRGDADIVIPLHTEELSVLRRDIVLGTVRVEVKTHERDQVVDELLAHERVEVERVPIGRIVEAMPEIREEGDTTIIPVVEEIVVTERRLVLKEEVRLRRVRTMERHFQTVVLRTQDAEVARIDPAQSGQPSNTTQGTA